MGAAQTLLDGQKDFITSLQSGASAYMFNAAGAAVEMEVLATTDLTIPFLDPIDPPLPAERPEGDFEPVELEIPTKDFIRPVLENIPTVGDGLKLPTFDAKYIKPTAPTTPSALRDFNAVAPIINTNFGFPDAPDLLNPQAPTFTEHAFPVKGDTSVERFNANSPVIIPDAPTDYATQFRINYRDNGVNCRALAKDVVQELLASLNPQYSVQMGAIESQLTRYLEGGTGLNAEVEDAIYSRAREKLDVEAKRVQDAAFADTAARGFTIPNGALYSALARARQDASNNNAKSATDIAVAQAEMEQKNLQFAVSTSAALRKSMIDSTMAYLQAAVSLNGQALQYAKNMLDADIEIYNTEVKVFTMRLDQYKAEASVYELKSRIAMNAVEIYKAEIQAYTATLGADKNKIEIYRSLMDANSVAAGLYKTRVDAVVSQASLEKMKLEMHQLAVQTFSAEVSAKNSEWQGYQAQIEGNLGAVKVYAAEVNAFEGQISAYKAQLSADIEKVNGVTAKNASLIQRYNAEVGAFEAELRANVTELAGKIDVQKSKLTKYQGDLAVNLDIANNALEVYKTNSAVNMSEAKFKLDGEVAKKNAQAAGFGPISNIHNSILEMYSGPAKATAGAMNALASVSETV